MTASAAASGGNACPASTAAGAATFCAATVTPAGAGVLPAAPAAVPGVSGDQQRQGLSRSRGRRSRSSGDGTDRRAKSAPEEGLLLLTALHVVGGGAVALPQIRLRVTELTLLLPVPGMRLEVRILVALPGILTARLVLGRRGLLQGMSFASLERVVVRLDLRVWRMLAALGVSGRGLLTATAPTVSVRVPLPVGGSGAVVRDRTLSRIARVTARGQACDCLLLLPACGPWKQDGWPDVGPRRVWRRLSLSLLWPGAAAGVPPVSGGASIAALPSVFCRSLPSSS